MDFAVRDVGFAAHLVPADGLQAPTERTRTVFGACGIANDQMPAEGSDDLCVELHGTGASGRKAGTLASDRLALNLNFQPMPMPRSDLLVWIDLEMTGLRPDTDVIIEIATIVTDANLDVIAEGPVLAIHQDEATLSRMDDWNQRQHGGSGLLARVRGSRVTVGDAEHATLDFLAALVQPGSSPMCGNTICQDRRFLARAMPRLEAFFHYRNLDVSTLKELARRWAPGVVEGFVKTGNHLALEDIRESVRELRHYRQHFVAPPFRGAPAAVPGLD